MDITPFTVYLISRLTPLHNVAEATAVISAIVSGFSLIVLFVTTAEDGWEDGVPAALRRFVRWPIALALVSLVVSVLTPTTKDAAAMIVLPRIANSQSVQELGDTVVELAKAWCEEFKPKKAEDKK